MEDTIALEELGGIGGKSVSYGMLPGYKSLLQDSMGSQLCKQSCFKLFAVLSYSACGAACDHWLINQSMWVTSLQVVHGVAGRDSCKALCESTAGCGVAHYTASGTCKVKVETNTLSLYVSGVDSIRVCDPLRVCFSKAASL